MPIRTKYNLSFELSPIIAIDVLNAVRLISSDAIGHDEISIKFLKKILPYSLDSIVHIFNHSIGNGSFPSLWNVVKIRPIEKITEPQSPSDTRPITVNSVMTKIFTFILNSQIKCFLNANNILHECQSAFREGFSCTTALIRVFEDIRHNIKNNKLTILVLLDIKSAYPSVSHDLLIHILRNLGFQSKSINWITSFIKNKNQYVQLGNQSSDHLSVSCGLLQGDNLSQTLFSLVINEIFGSISFCKGHLYADDLSIYLESNINDLSTNICKINSDIKNIGDWMLSNGLQLNPSKTNAIIIGSEHLLSQINLKTIQQVCVDDNVIPFSSEVKYLGYFINENFNSKSQINNIIKKVNFSLSRINYIRNGILTNLKLKIVRSMIFPLFDYGAILHHGYNIYGTGNERYRLQLAQNSCIRFITNIPKFEHVTPAINKFMLHNSFNRSTFLIICFMHKYIYFGGPSYLSDIFILNKNNTRAGMDTKSLVVSKVNKARDEFLLSHCISKLWNSLPSNIRMISSHDIFRRCIFKYLFELQLKNQ